MRLRTGVCFALPLTGLCAAAGFVACSSGNGAVADAGAHFSPDSGTQDSTTGAETGTPDGGSGDAGAEGAATCQVYDASSLVEASVQAGFIQVWQVYKCYHCHQSSSDVVDDAGDGILLNGNSNGVGTPKTYPPNLTNSPEGLGCWTDPQIATAILEGTDPEGGALCAPMPVYGTAASSPGRPMDAGTAQEIIDYIRSLQPSSNTVPPTTCAAPEAGPDAETDAPADAPTDAMGDAADGATDAGTD